MTDTMDSGVADGQEQLNRHAALLREVDHRVKNNLQLISSVIQLQSRRTDNPAARQALRAALQRVSAVAAVDRRIFRTEGREVLDLAQTVRELVADLAAAAGRDGVALQMALDPIVIDAPQAAPLALLVNELVSNALQHAFPDGRTGVVGVGLQRTADGFVLSVADDGVGVADIAALPRGFGLTMTQMLCRQLHGSLDLADARPGLRATVNVSMAA